MGSGSSLFIISLTLSLWPVPQDTEQGVQLLHSLKGQSDGVLGSFLSKLRKKIKRI